MEWFDWVREFTIPVVLALSGAIWGMWRTLTHRMDAFEEKVVPRREFDEHKIQQVNETKRIWSHLDGHESRIAKSDILHAEIATDMKHVADTLDDIKDQLRVLTKKLMNGEVS